MINLEQLQVPRSRDVLERLQSERKRAALTSAARSPFMRARLPHLPLERLDDPQVWSRIPILDKEQLRAMADEDFYTRFCHQDHDGIAEYWRSGGSTGRPLFYPRSFADIRAAEISFARAFACAGLASGARAHNSFPLGIHPAGQMFARAATIPRIGMTWAGAGTTTPSSLQLELIQRLQPTLWMGMPSYGLHLANLAAAQDQDLAGSSVCKLLCSAEPLSAAKRAKLARRWGAEVFDTFGMTEAGLMGAEDAEHPRQGFRVWTDLYHIEIIDPSTHDPVPPGQPGALVVTALCTNHITPFLRWSSGDIVVQESAPESSSPFGLFPLLRHAHRTAGFFKVRGVNINHAEFEDLVFGMDEIADFKCEAFTLDDVDQLRVSIEVARGADGDQAARRLAANVKKVFEISSQVVVLAQGTLARDFEASIKAQRFVDGRERAQ